MAVKITSQSSLLEETSFTESYREEVIEKLRNSGLTGMDLVREIEEENCKMIIPSARNIYEWARKYPESTLAAGLDRVEKCLDLSHHIYSGFSAGKDSTISANLELMELNLRYMRYALGVTRDGEMKVDPLDEKWAKHKQKINMSMQDAEVCFTMSNDYSKRFLKKYGPQGLNLLNFSWLCLRMSWQSGVDFDSGVLVSWDSNKKNSWVQPMPTNDELYGFDVVSEENFTTCNAVALDTLPPESQEYHREHGNVVKVQRQHMFGVDLNQQNTKAYWEEEIEAVCNYGRGPLTFYTPFDHEKDYNHDYSYWFADTSWLVDYNSLEDLENIQKAIDERYPDLKDDVWQMTPQTSRIKD